MAVYRPVKKSSGNAKEPFVVMVKPVGSRCNMRCSYCYYLSRGQYSTHEVQTVMSDAMLERLIRDTINASPGPVVSFVWHGGEPTLAGLDFYRRAVKLQNRYLPRGFRVWNNLQTNGLLINDEWARFLADNHFDVGLSIDGTELVHDENRRDVLGKGTFERVRKAADCLKKAGIRPDLLCTVNSATVQRPDEVYETLCSLDTGWVQFIPIVVRDGNALSPLSVTAESYGAFLIRMFDLWITHDLGKTDIQLFAEMAKIMAGAKPSLCMMSETCGRALVAEEDGSIYACDHFVDPAHRIGNFMESPIGSMVTLPVQHDFGRSKKTGLTAQCKACPYLKFCGGGCLKDRFGVAGDGESGQYVLCNGLRAFFSHAEPILKEVMALSRQGLSSEEIMRRFG